MGHAHSKAKNFEDWYEKLHQCPGHSLPKPPYKDCDHYIADCPNTSGCPYDCADCTAKRVAIKTQKQEDFWQALIEKSLSEVDGSSKGVVSPGAEGLGKEGPRRHSIGEREREGMESEQLRVKRFGTVGYGRRLPRPSLGFNFLDEMGVEDCKGGA